MTPAATKILVDVTTFPTDAWHQPDRKVLGRRG